MPYIDKSVNSRKIENICVIRLSAIGDVVNTALVVSTLRKSLPHANITWIIESGQYDIVKHLKNIHFVLFDKKNKIQSLRTIRKELKGTIFDALLLMQYSLRANLLSTLVKSPLRIGYQYPRSREGHRLFINQRIGGENEHVVDTLFEFAEVLGVTERMNHLESLYTKSDCDFVEQYISPQHKTLLISPCASEEVKQWSIKCYAEFAAYANKKYSMQVILCADDKSSSYDYCKKIQQQTTCEILNLAGQTTLNQLCALVKYCDVVLSPDSATAHIASAVNTPVISLYAVTNPNRAGPYNSRKWCVDYYHKATRVFLNKTPHDIRWGTKIRRKGVMDMITLKDVCEKMDILFDELNTRN